MLVLGNHIGVTEYIVNSDGCWVLLDQATKEKYCFNTDGEAWSLAMGTNEVLYIGTLNDIDKGPSLQTLTTFTNIISFTCRDATVFAWGAGKSSKSVVNKTLF